MTEGEGSAPASGEPANTGGQPADTGANGSGGQPADTGVNGSGGQSTSLLNGGTSGASGQPNGGQTGDQGVQPGKTFLDQISDDTIKNDPSLKSIKSVEDLAKSYVHAQHLVGKDRIALPSGEDDHEAWSDVLSKLGRPNDPSEYEIPKPAEDSPVQLPEGMDQEFSKKAHELGLTNKQARELFGWYIEGVAEPQYKQAEEQAQQARQQAEQTLRKEFGNAFEDRVSDARRAVKEYGGDELMDALTQSGMANNPEMVKFLAKIGEGLREDTVGGSSPQFGRSPDQAKQEITRLKQDPQFMQTYTTKNATGHSEAVERMSQLYKDAYPEG